MHLYTELPVGAQTAFSELYEVTQQAELHRSISSLNGSIQFKEVSGKRYAYFVYRDAVSGRLQQLYVGPDSPLVQELQTRAKQDPPSAEALARHARAAISHGCAGVVTKHFRIIRQLADARFFRAGGLLIGSHAFLVLGNMLGVRWTDSTRTLDVDFAHPGQGGNVSVALPADLSIDVHSAIESLKMGFLPGLALRGSSTTSSYASASEPDLRLDFLTPARRDDAPIHDPGLKVALQPLKFLDYLIEQCAQTIILSNTNATIVNVPSPGRFALHKLVVAAERPISEQTKSNKDIRQAAALLDYLVHNSPLELSNAWLDLKGRGPGWMKRVNQSLRRVSGQLPELLQELQVFQESMATDTGAGEAVTGRAKKLSRTRRKSAHAQQVGAGAAESSPESSPPTPDSGATDR